jgi:hypothetical protein
LACVAVVFGDQQQSGGEVAGQVGHVGRAGVCDEPVGGLAYRVVGDRVPGGGLFGAVDQVGVRVLKPLWLRIWHRSRCWSRWGGLVGLLTIGSSARLRGR